MTITQITPVFGVNYFSGWIGFSRAFDTVGDLIAWGERREQGSLPSVNHAFVVTGDNEIVEAQMDAGVVRTTLTSRTLEPKQKVYLRNPIGFVPPDSDGNLFREQVCCRAESQIGAKYDKLLILEQAMADTIVGHAVNELFGNWPHEELAALIARATPHEFICSFLASFALLLRGGCAIDPQTLFGDSRFGDQIYECSLLPKS